MMYITSQTGVTVVLPSPLPEDRQGNLATTTTRRAMNNTLYAYVRNSGRLRLTYKLQLFRPKALELQAFVDAYLEHDLTLTDYRGRRYRVSLTADPFDYAAVAVREITEVTLTFEGVQIL